MKVEMISSIVCVISATYAQASTFEIECKQMAELREELDSVAQTANNMNVQADQIQMLLENQGKKVDKLAQILEKVLKYTVCGQGDVTVVSGNTYSSSFSVQNLLAHENKDIFGKNYWLSPDGVDGTFILDMGCALSFDAIRLVNTHNTNNRDRSTRRFRLFTSMSPSGPWTQVLDTELEDSTQQQDPLPLQIIALDTAAVSAQFVKFDIATHWGVQHYGGGLQYFDIQRN